MSTRTPFPLRRDALFLFLGAAWGTVTILREGPWPLMLISAGTMLGPGFLRLWLSGTATAGKPPSLPAAPQEPPSSSSPTSYSEGSRELGSGGTAEASTA